MSQRGIQRERAVRDHLRNQDWLAFRAPASLGVADVIALRAGNRPRLIEVKSTAQGPYEHFGPADRQKLRWAAEIAGADAYLAWWPARGKLRFIPAEEWPGGNATPPPGGATGNRPERLEINSDASSGRRAGE